MSLSPENHLFSTRISWPLCLMLQLFIVANQRQCIRRALRCKRSHLPTPAVSVASTQSGHGSAAGLAQRRSDQHGSRRHLGAPDADPHVRWGESRDGRAYGRPYWPQHRHIPGDKSQTSMMTNSGCFARPNTALSGLMPVVFYFVW